MISAGSVRFPRPPAWSWSAYAGSARSTPPGSPGWRTRAWSSWSPPSTPVSRWTHRSSTARTCTPISIRSPGRGRSRGCGGGRGAAGRALPAGPHRPHRRRRCLPGEASGDVAGRLHPAARPRAADRTRRPGRFPEPRFARLGDAAGRRLRHRAGGPGRRRRVLVADRGLLDPLTVVGPPQPERPAGDRRGGHQPPGARGGHGAWPSPAAGRSRTSRRSTPTCTGPTPSTATTPRWSGCGPPRAST